MLGLPETEGPASDRPSSARAGWMRPEHVTELEPHGLPAGFRAAGVAAGIKPEGLDVGVVASSEPDTVSAARFTTNARVGAPVMVSREAELDRLRAVAANSGCSNVGDGPRGLETARRHAGGRCGGARRGGRSGGGGVDRRDRHRAAARPSARRGARRLRARSATTPTTSPRRSSRATRHPSAPAWRWRCPPGRVRLAAQAKGAGHDLAALRDDVLLRPDGRRARAADTLDLLTGVCVQALVRPHQRRRPALHQRHRRRAGERRVRRAGGAGVAGRARARRGARRPAAPARARDRRTTARARGASGEWS